ncbi:MULTISPECIES: hypothetical protein [Brachybacterium]|uniref:Uncharacterized protein n=1 Tax=Brachybacterium alimentarium TaxID=47845 RepID=A0A2A3YH86_9MICO|nr:MULTISPECIES: hypothetical protein [Brachybacterium]PCC34853.1 hypothetical protein CIK71_04790 [Brachybacterium alimentarium]PCC38638.1 hypothetical protein CIK66_11870 [Brachybacterium alimentarium]RCS62359.1 hypothetical protein CIK81_14060 [Brachybacterium sp. JB7]RCS68986.1 hypothetical protein CIK73_07310 [Brachybacterium alimentarium]RCS75979.1 hypothetical protein CIK68_01770 [Brachybacterium alimentarium]
MTTTQLHSPSRARRRGKPAVGRPSLFVLLLGFAALGVMGLLIAGPSLGVPVSIGAAAGLMGLVAFAWVVAGPRL